MQTKNENQELQFILSKIRNIFFDVDGTLFSSEHMLEEVYHQSILEFFKNKHYNKKTPNIRRNHTICWITSKRNFSEFITGFKRRRTTRNQQ
jgi:FMN phosphatase YigB (HAD superfamily)